MERTALRTGSRRLLLDELLDGGAELVDGLLVALLDCVHDAVAQVVLQDDLAGVVQGAADGGELDQHLAAVVALLDHPFYLFQVADGPGQPVDDGLLVLVDMGMAVTVAVRVAVVVLMAVLMLMLVVVFVVVGMGVVMVMDMAFLVGMVRCGRDGMKLVGHGRHLQKKFKYVF